MTDYPKSWHWTDDGPTVDGTYIRLDEGPSAYGRIPIVVLDVAGVERGVWLAQTVLRKQFVHELERREARDFEPGERISVTRGSEKRTSASGYHYWPFETIFRDAPASKRDALAMLTSEPRVTPLITEPQFAPGDDDIPF